ncbi:putative domain HDIG-containing protein [Desulfoscipio gibsoniae DSM 7213]|uniref:Putative domain HDIG-containing protein n=1 Tax=Desulfoscipio gibsoniae DSM 7213 TaxID=767817 RepID=R4KGE7_9FIRM|nr:putative domain HDIG-containing protein [Desulfoscipio gibsoniae DSM 7213]
MPMQKGNSWIVACRVVTAIVSSFIFLEGGIFIKLSTSYLLPGMILERPLYGQSGELLLRKGSVLTAQSIMAMRRAGVLAVRVTSSFETERGDELNEVIQLNALKAVKEWNKSFDKKIFATLLKTIEDIIDEILSGKVVIGSLSEICLADTYTYTHSIDVAILAIAIGVKMGFHRKKLICLGVGSILHDLGKTKIPNEILNKPGKLTPDEFSIIQKHPVYGYETIKEHDINRISAEIVLNHHERYNGSGYPNGLHSNEINELAYICAIADVYSAMTADRVYRKALPPHEAYEMIMVSGEINFTPVTVEAFLKCIVPYPVGSIVYLSNGHIAQIYRQNPGLVFRPVVKLLSTGEEINLGIENNIVIKGLVPQENIRQFAMEGGAANVSLSTACKPAGNS